MKNRYYWGSFLLLAIFFTLAWQQGLQADETSPAATPAEIERPLSSEALYLPIILSSILSPQAQAVVDLVNKSWSGILSSKKVSR